jgi:hypothetical protein
MATVVHFHFTLGPANDAAGSGYKITKVGGHCVCTQCTEGTKTR